MKECILSIDASLSSTGWAVIDKSNKNVIDVGKICTKSKNPEDERIQYIIDNLLEIRDKYNISEGVIEDGHVRINVRTALQLAKLRGGIIFVLNTYDTPITSLHPSTIRKEFLNNGNADKEAVAEEIIKLYPDNVFVQTLGPFSDKSNKNKNSDMYDAISIGLAYLKIKDKENILVKQVG